MYITVSPTEARKSVSWIIGVEFLVLCLDNIQYVLMLNVRKLANIERWPLHLEQK